MTPPAHHGPPFGAGRFMCLTSNGDGGSVMDMTSNRFGRGDRVMVRHGASAWLGIVTSSQPGHITVSYPGANRPGDDRPARELIDLTKHTVTPIERTAR